MEKNNKNKSRNRGDQHVTPSNGKWQVKEANKSSSIKTTSKDKAVEYAEDEAMDKNSSVVVHNERGRIESKHKVESESDKSE